jgi:hypothetical protein
MKFALTVPAVQSGVTRRTRTGRRRGRRGRRGLRRFRTHGPNHT